jgi:hypothetical protein
MSGYKYNSQIKMRRDGLSEAAAGLDYHKKARPR